MKKLSPQDKTIHDQFSRYGKNAREWTNKCVLLLPKIEKNRVWEKKGFKSIYEYAAKLAGMSRYKVDDSLRVIKKVEDKPELMKIVKKKGLNAIRPIVTIATEETADFWAKKASEMSKHTLAVYAKDYKKEREEAVKAFRPGPGLPLEDGYSKPTSLQKDEKVQISMKLDKEIVEALKEVKGEGDWNEAMRKLLKFSKEELNQEKKVKEEAEQRFQEELLAEKPEKITNCTRYTTTKIKKFILKRSRGVCEHPNCNKKGEHIHHLTPFSIKKEHDPVKMILVCSDHHKIIHLGYLDPVSTEASQENWRQIEELPWYDIKNLVNLKINQYAHE